MTGLQRHPSYLSAHVTLGRALIEVGRYEEAQEELEHVLKLAPENLAAIRGLAEIHHRRGEDVQSTTVAPIRRCVKRGCTSASRCAGVSTQPAPVDSRPVVLRPEPTGTAAAPAATVESIPAQRMSRSRRAKPSAPEPAAGSCRTGTVAPEPAAPNASRLAGSKSSCPRSSAPAPNRAAVR